MGQVITAEKLKLDHTAQLDLLNSKDCVFIFLFSTPASLLAETLASITTRLTELKLDTSRAVKSSGVVYSTSNIWSLTVTTQISKA
jgi:hypothetical protein